jgi:hypothetical protein
VILSRGHRCAAAMGERQFGLHWLIGNSQLLSWCGRVLLLVMRVNRMSEEITGTDLPRSVAVTRDRQPVGRTLLSSITAVHACGTSVVMRSQFAEKPEHKSDRNPREQSMHTAQN